MYMAPYVKILGNIDLYSRVSRIAAHAEHTK